ncbi:hypothetical protein H4R19_006867, partial [Coemansia spiralis]
MDFIVPLLVHQQSHQSLPPPSLAHASMFPQPTVFLQPVLSQAPILSQPAVLTPVPALPTFSRGLGSGVLVTSPVDPLPVHTTRSVADFGSEAVNLEYSIMASMLSYALDNNASMLGSAAPGAQVGVGTGAPPVATITIPSA